MGSSEIDQHGEVHDDPATGSELPLSEPEARRVALALLAHPVAFLIWVGGLASLSLGTRSPVLIGLMVLTFLIFAVITTILFGVMIRIAGRSNTSLARTMLDFNFKIPWSLMLGRLGRRTFEKAQLSLRLLQVQRLLMILALGGLVAWMIFIMSGATPET